MFREPYYHFQCCPNNLAVSLQKYPGPVVSKTILSIMGGMAEKTPMLDTFEKEGFSLLTNLLRQHSLTSADSGSCPLNRAWSLRLGCIVFSQPCRSKRVKAKSRIDLPFKLSWTDVILDRYLSF
jgi:hypothetical protein